MRKEQLGKINNDIMHVSNEVSSKSKRWDEQPEDEEYQNNGENFFDDYEEDNMLGMDISHLGNKEVEAQK